MFSITLQPALYHGMKTIIIILVLFFNLIQFGVELGKLTTVRSNAVNREKPLPQLPPSHTLYSC